MVEALIEFLGSYTPVTQDYYFWNEALQKYEVYTQIVPGLAGVDWPWIGSFILLLICIFCMFKALGGIFKR